MKKLVLPIFISFIWIFYRSNQYFEGSINNNPEVKSLTSHQRFFLPFPKNYEIISEYEESGYEYKIINTKNEISYLNSFYQEILRSKNYLKDYEYENDNVQEFKYSKDRNEITISLTKQKDGTSIIFKSFKN